MARWVPGGRYLVTWWKVPGYLPSGDPFFKFRPALGTATELPCTLCAMLSVFWFVFGLCPFYLSFVSVCATRTSRNLLPFLSRSSSATSHLPIFFHFSSLSPSILTCHPCCECLGGSVVGGFLAPKNVGRLQSRSLFEEICFF